MGARRPCRAPSPDGSGASAECSALAPLARFWPLRALPGGLCLARAALPAWAPAARWAALALARAPPLPLGRSGSLGRWRAACARRSPPRPPPAGRAAAWPGPAWAGLASARARSPSRRVFGSPLACAGLPGGRPLRRCGLPCAPCRAAPVPPGLGPPSGVRLAPPARRGCGPCGAVFPPRPAGLWGATARGLRARVRTSGLWPPLPFCPACGRRWVSPQRGLDKLERLCYYDGAGASRSPPITGLLPVTRKAEVEGGRFFRLPLPSPSIRRGRRRGMGTFHVPRTRHGRGRRQRYKAKQGRGQKSAPLLAFSNPPALQLNKTALYFVE